VKPSLERHRVDGGEKPIVFPDSRSCVESVRQPIGRMTPVEASWPGLYRSLSGDRF
jgi:hypothetical protein